MKWLWDVFVDCFGGFLVDTELGRVLLIILFLFFVFAIMSAGE